MSSRTALALDPAAQGRVPPELPAAVTEWFKRLDADGAAAMEDATWWQTMRKDTDSWTSSENCTVSGIIGMGGPHRSASPAHFVGGSMSPFYIQSLLSTEKETTRVVWAVYFGPYTSNGSVEIGTGQGGAQSSIFDLLCATVASIGQQAPVTPIPGLFRAEAWIDRIEDRKIIIKAKLTPGDDPSRVLSSAEAVHIKLPRLQGRSKY
eukprot:TRINITY_DN24969_c0_g1_i1.p1 TRINITY_DN24969_c0_g1~~TRINITY_DN24969_c0_g1_i1.p1  ORF type:complete len:207 (+),score=32.43 TRINITY_DN24969_c0_g1_i1:33-653(+)